MYEPALCDVAEIHRTSAAVAIVTPLMPETMFGCSAGAAAADDAAAAGSGAAGGNGTSSSAWSRPMLLLFERARPSQCTVLVHCAAATAF
jgi:hypothetical protein